jgi:hypothetical protein
MNCILSVSISANAAATCTTGFDPSWVHPCQQHPSPPSSLGSTIQASLNPSRLTALFVPPPADSANVNNEMRNNTLVELAKVNAASNTAPQVQTLQLLSLS